MPLFDLYPLTFDAVHQVATRVRACDRLEIGACLPDGYNADQVAREWVSYAQHGFVATADGQPVAAVALVAMNRGLFSAGMMATDRWRDIARQVTQFVREIWTGEMVAAGMRRCEARSMAGHPTAGRWLEHLGFVREAECPDFGRGGETFHLYAWRASDHV